VKEELPDVFVFVSVAHAIAASGILSRRRAAAAIRAGRVSCNGEIVRDPFAPAGNDPDLRIDGRPLPAAASKVCYLLHKPCGYVCSTVDRFSSKLAIGLLPELPGVRLFSAGRLDAGSEGMILFTNDGNLVHRLENPEERIPKEYRVETAHPLSASAIAALRAGIPAGAGNVRLRPEQLDELASGLYRFVLMDGKRHEIRRLVQAGGTTVRRLLRVRIGRLELGDLPSGSCRRLTPADVALLTADA